ncbi:unnamed protein product [Urochloa humidicola]
MVHLEVLSFVKASESGQELNDIRILWQLRKLGVAIDDKDNHLKKLLLAISDLHECLQTLSIILPMTSREVTAQPIGEVTEHTRYSLKHSPDVLESLSISGTTEKVPLFQLLAKDCKQLTKVTLTSTWLNQDDLQLLAKLPMLCCVRLRYTAHAERELIFKEHGFQNLKHFLVEGSNITAINFEDGATPELQSIILFSTDDIKSISGVEGLLKLREIELNNKNLLPLFNNAKQITRMILRGTLLDQGDIQTLGKKPNLRYLVLLDMSCRGYQITLNKDEFPKLNVLIVDSPNITRINFNSESALKLEKIVWTFTCIESLDGINNLPKLKELELNGGPVPSEVEDAINKLNTRLGFYFRYNKPEIQEQAKGDEATEEGDDTVRFLFCWKNKV